MDLLFYHRRLRCLLLMDLKLGRFSHAGAGQTHIYLRYAAEHWAHDARSATTRRIDTALDIVKYAYSSTSERARLVA